MGRGHLRCAGRYHRGNRRVAGRRRTGLRYRAFLAGSVRLRLSKLLRDGSRGVRRECASWLLGAEGRSAHHLFAQGGRRGFGEVPRGAQAGRQAFGRRRVPAGALGHRHQPGRAERLRRRRHPRRVLLQLQRRAGVCAAGKVARGAFPGKACGDY